MTSNPYAGGDAEFDYMEGPQRTSLLAIGSLVSSLACCIPGLGVLAIILGALSMAFISGSQGRLAGRGMAIAGLIIGIMVSTLWGALGVGVGQAWTYYSKQMAPVVAAVVEGAAADDIEKVRQQFTNGDDITEEQTARLVAFIEAEGGAIQGLKISFGDLVASFERVYGGRSQNTQVNMQGGNGAQPAPFVVQCDNGPVLVWAIFDETTLNTGTISLLDFIVPLASGDAISLRSSDVAREISLGLNFVPLGPEAMPTPANTTDPEGGVGVPEESLSEEETGAEEPSASGG